jgi:hypothetical protein
LIRSIAFGAGMLVDSTAAADPVLGAFATVPAVGDALPEHGGASWPKLDWLYGPPSASDAAGKVVIHWFCTPKVQACVDDLARLITLRDAGHAYIIAYVDASGRAAKTLDPVHESEGIGRGTLAYGRGVTKLVKQLGFGKGPASIVVDPDGKVALVSIGADVATLDARDAKVAELAAAIHDYTTSHDGPTTAKPGQRFELTLRVQLAHWLAYDRAAPRQFQLAAPADLHCDAKALQGDQLAIDGSTLTARLHCAAPRGSYEVRGTIRFGFRTPTGAQGIGDDAATWKFEVAP